MLTFEDIDTRLALLPPHLRVYGEAYCAQAYPQRPRTPKRSRVAQRLYDDCRWDVASFAKEFFPHICENEFNKVHLDYYEAIRIDQNRRGVRTATAAFRGASKTTGCVSMRIFHACAYLYEDYILYLTNSADNATLKTKDIRDELAENDKFIEVYGPQESPIWNQGFWVTLGGVGVAAAGRGSQLRGKTKRFKRFSLILVDDLEHPEQVLSEIQRDKTHNFLHNDVFKLGHPGTNIECFGTILHPQSELSGLLKTPGWRRNFYQAVVRFADASSVPLWQQWREIFLDLSNPHHAEDARAFFEAHEAEMLRNHEVLWPDRKPYYDLMVERLIEGESSFWQELQNSPLSDSRHIFQMDDAGYCDLHPEGITRYGGHYLPYIAIDEVAAYWDPTPDKKDVKGTDFAACSVVMRDRNGYIYCVDAYCAQESSTDKQIQAIVELLWTWKVPLLGIEANGFQSLLPGNLREAIARRAQEEGVLWDVEFVPITNMRNKLLRIKSLESLVANKWLQFSRRIPSAAFQQMIDFIPVEGAGKVDFPDSLEGAVRVVKGLYDRQSIF